MIKILLKSHHQLSNPMKWTNFQKQQLELMQMFCQIMLDELQELEGGRKRSQRTPSL